MSVSFVAMGIILPLLGVIIVLALVRLVRGPSVPDRVVALDLMSTVAIAVAAVYGMITGQPAFLDVALVLALVSFLGTVAFARYVERSR